MVIAPHPPRRRLESGHEINQREPRRIGRGHSSSASALAQGSAQVLLGITGVLIIMAGLMGWGREWSATLADLRPGVCTTILAPVTEPGAKWISPMRATQSKTANMLQAASITT